MVPSRTSCWPAIQAEDTQPGCVTGTTLAAGAATTHLSVRAGYGTVGVGGLLTTGAFAVGALPLHFGPGFWARRISLSAIEAAVPVRNAAWHGWGIRHTSRGWRCNISGPTAGSIRGGAQRAETFPARVLRTGPLFPSPASSACVVHGLLDRCRSPFLAIALGIVLAGGGATPAGAQHDSDTAAVAPERVAALIDAWQDDPRGPYAGIRWFCPDGSVIPAQKRCDEPGGLQHARLTPEARALHDVGLYLGQILAGTDTTAFWDADDRHSRLKQYQLGTYLYAVDDGWILRRARYYRGAFQAEDEAAWGRTFLRRMLRDEGRIRSHFYLLRQAARDLPHGAGGNRWQRIRATSEAIADAVSAFMPLRIKIHGQPGPSDLDRVRAFRRKRADALSEEVQADLKQLEQDLSAVYETSDAARLGRFVSSLPAGHAPTGAARTLVDEWPSLSAAERVRRGGTLLLRLRRALPALPAAHRLPALDLSNALEALLLRRAGAWTPSTLRGLLDKGVALARAAAGAGHLELWEWERVAARLQRPDSTQVARSAFDARADALQRASTWGTAMTTAHYQDVVDRYAAFEPAARGFIDDRVRSSVLLPLGRVAGRLGRAQARVAGREHRLLGLDAGRARGLTSGVAAGTLHVVTEAPDAAQFDEDALYVLNRVPPDLPPVSGLLTTGGGNTVSHVQLLARNLGIPTVALTPAQVEALARYDGTRVFLAVSPGGAVRMVPARRMSARERALTAPAATDTLIHISTDEIVLSHDSLMPVRALRAADSGRIVGPKAANLGQLAALFPSHVPSSLAIPFGVFRTHMDQPMPGTDGSYWDYLTTIFAERRTGRAGPSARVQHRLDTLRTAIRHMPLRPDFRSALRRRFRAVFGGAMGTVDVFLRSDTNMEDLPTFTGAGLNLTVPNVVDSTAIFDAVRRVWASPYTERSYRWRQRVLDNPEQVYPSVLLQRSVPADKSGVMITTGVSTGGPDALTLSFSRGVGGAVQGEATEMTLLRPGGDALLLSPLRTPTIPVLPPDGGVARRPTSFHRPVLTAANRDTLRRLADTLRARLPSVPGVASDGPYDVELGFRDGHLRLFQVRPYVEAGRADIRAYLRRLDATATPRPTVDLTAAPPPSD